MGLNPLEHRGIPVADQVKSWSEINPEPYDKDRVDPYTRTRVILMNGIEVESIIFSHQFARMTDNVDIKRKLALSRRIDAQQQKLVNGLNPGDQSPLETTIGFEQVAVEVTASVAEAEPDPYLAQVFRFGLLEDFDHLYRYSALMDRLEGKDANALLQSYSDVVPGRPTMVEHRAPQDDLRTPYDKDRAQLITKLHALTIMAGENQTHDYYMTIGPMFSDPTARQLYAEIASIEEQHVTQYESIIDPRESWLEKWLVHEATEAYNYYSCVESEPNRKVKAIWERFLDYELGHVRFVAELFEQQLGRDAGEILRGDIPQPIRYVSHREFVRQVLREEVGLRARGTQIVDGDPPDSPSVGYRQHANSEGSPSERVAAGWVWRPGTELTNGHHPMTEARRGRAHEEHTP
jgi:rubrerythrin